MNLNRQHLCDMFSNNFVVIKVVFDGIQTSPTAQVKHYSYRVPADWPVEIGTKFLVCTGDIDSCPELKVVTTVRVYSDPNEAGEQPYKYKWVVAPYNTIVESYKDRLVRDEQFSAAVAKLERAMTRVSMQQQLALAMKILPQEDRRELMTMFQPFVGNLLEAQDVGDVPASDAVSDEAVDPKNPF